MRELELGREHLLSAPAAQNLMSFLRRRLESITRNIKWVPEQAEDLYDILVDGTTVVHIEIPRDLSSGEGDIVFEKRDVREYLNSQRRLTKPYRRRIELALQLAQQA
jgi:hypothetical protein